MNEKRVHASVTRKLLRWLLGGFVALIAVAVLLVSLFTVAAVGTLGFLVLNQGPKSVRIVDVNASNGLIFFDLPEVLERYDLSGVSGLLPFENFTIEVVVEVDGKKEYLSCKLNRMGIGGLLSPDYCSLALAAGSLVSLVCTCYS